MFLFLLNLIKLVFGPVVDLDTRHRLEFRGCGIFFTPDYHQSVPTLSKHNTPNYGDLVLKNRLIGGSPECPTVFNVPPYFHFHPGLETIILVVDLLLYMSDLDPVAFDIETTGFSHDSTISVAGFAHELGESLILNCDGRDVRQDRIVETLNQHSKETVRLTITADEEELLTEVSAVIENRLDGNTHYLTAFNGETWGGGFDIPFCRTAYLQHGKEWPLGDIAYADMVQIVDRFNTDGHSDLVGVYDVLIGEDTCDPFDSSEKAVEAFENRDWTNLLLHNLADIQRTRELAGLAERFLPRSDFQMKNLKPPGP